MQALGFIETMGLIGAIEAADAMLKAADVRLLEKNLSSGGLVTISVAGEVAAVKASVDAAAAAVARIHGAKLYSQHVIARPDAELAGILRVEPCLGAKEKTNVAQAAPAKTLENTENKEDAAHPAYSAAQLKKMDVQKLRKILHETVGCTLSAEQAATLAKKDLIEAILGTTGL